MDSRAVMKLFWLAFQTDDGPEVFIQTAHSLLFARLVAMIKGQKDFYSEGHVLDEATAKKVPKEMIGRTLSQTEALRLLKRMA